MKKIFSVSTLLWIVYLALLGVLLPHTAWAFSQFEPVSDQALVPWAAAFAFEAAIAALTHKLARHIETTPKRLRSPAKFTYRYMNAYSFGLLAAIGLSSLANLAHAVQFGRTLTIFTTWGIPFAVYAVAFGATLPLVSLVFARVLSNVVESEADDDPALVEAKERTAQLRSDLREASQRAINAEARAKSADDRFAALGDLVVKLFGDGEKRERILAAHQLWPALPGAAISVITGASAAHVSEVLRSEVLQEVIA